MRDELKGWRTDWFVVFVVLVLTIGCDNRKPAKTTPATNKTDVSGETTVPATGSSAKQVADGVLKQLSEGKVPVSQLSASFKKHLTKAFTDEDKKAGFAASDVEAFLRRFEKATFEDVKEDKLGNGFSYRGRMKTANDINAFSLRLVKNGNDYLVDWLHKSERQCSLPEVPSDPDLAAAYDVARNFIDTLLGGDLTQTHALMNPAWRKSIAPPFEPDLKKGLDFDRGFLTTKTRSWKADYVGYGLTKPELASSKDTATFVANMEALGTKTPYLVKASKDKTTGEWLIDSFAKQ